jgi:hypothetical protein
MRFEHPVGEKIRSTRNAQTGEIIIPANRLAITLRSRTFMITSNDPSPIRNKMADH